MSTSALHAPVDLSVLPALTGCDDPDMLREFMNDFLDIAREGEVALCAAQAAAQLGEMAQVAHRIKSSARYVGAMRLGELCEALEGACKQQDSDQAQALMALWQHEWQKVDAFLGAHA